jgi:hypothetical protein
MIGPEGGELAVSDPEDEREIAVVGPTGRRHARILMTKRHDRVVGGGKLVGLDDQIGQLPADDVKPGYEAVVAATDASPRDLGAKIAVRAVAAAGG